MRKTVFLFLTLWVFQTNAQTLVLVKAFNEQGSDYAISTVNVLNNKFMFALGRVLWASDGTEVGTKSLGDIYPWGYPPNLYAIGNGKLFYLRIVPNLPYYQIWQTDLANSATSLLIEFNAIDIGLPQVMVYMNGSLFFFAPNGVLKLWKVSLPVLPVELITFNAKPTNKKAQLDWKTAAELNTLGYDIERSTDGQTWSKLGFVGAKNKPSEYQYFDQTPNLNQVNYYRLCTVDIDGKKEFSKIESVKFNEIRSPIKIYPSVTVGVINIETTLNIQQVWVSNASGQIVLTSTQSSLNLGSLPTGVYVVTVKGGDSIFSETVFKQ